MTYALDDDPTRRLAKLIVGFVPRHPYATVSISVHAVVLTLLYYFGSYVIEAKKQDEQVRASVQAASHARTEKRVQDMEKIKTLLEKSSPSRAAVSKPIDDEVTFSATSLPKQPQELLKEAKTLSKSIDDVAKEIKAEELAKVLKIPKEKALEQLEAPPPVPEMPLAPLPTDAAQVADEIKKLETKARETLMQRQEELERQEQGVGVSSSAEAASTLNDKAGKEASAGGKADGANAQANGVGTGQGAQSGAKGDGGAGVRAEIATFINRDIAQPKNKSSNYAFSNGDLFDRTPSSMLALGGTSSTKGMGRIFGEGGQYATRVFVNTWYLIGPFEGKHGHGMFANDSYPPEQAVLLDAVYFGKGKRLLKWKYFSATSYPLIPPDQSDDAVYYGYTELMMDEAMDLTMAIGADDDSQVWLNDKLVWKGGNVSKQSFFDHIYRTQNQYKAQYNLNEGSRKVHFNKGRNKMLFKLSNGPGRVFFSMVLTH